MPHKHKNRSIVVAGLMGRITRERAHELVTEGHARWTQRGELALIRDNFSAASIEGSALWNERIDSREPGSPEYADCTLREAIAYVAARSPYRFRAR
jgi:hypothetical protein